MWDDTYHSFFTEKLIYHKTVDNAVSTKPKNLTETEDWSPKEPKTVYDQLQDSDCVEASETSSFLELKPLGVSDMLMNILQFKVLIKLPICPLKCKIHV